MTDQTSDEIVAFHEQFVETILNEQEFGRLSEFVGENIVAQTNNSATEGIEAYRQSTMGLLGAFRQFEATILDSYVDGDTVVARTRYSGVQTGAFVGIPSAESEVVWESVVIARVADRKFVDTYAIHDQISILGQLGAMDLPAI
jgi:predicted ester cyclase